MDDLCSHFPLFKIFSIMNAHWFVFENISPKTFKIFKLDMAHSPIEAHSVNQ